MVDFLKNNTFISMEDYLWKYSIPYLRIMSIDNTRIHYLSDKQEIKKNATVINSAEDLLNDFGIPIISTNNNNSNKDNK